MSQITNIVRTKLENVDKTPFVPSNKISEDAKKDMLRIRRKDECFTVINRGKLWYDTLSDDQLAELRNWYTEWLNVTETMVIPSTPEFINNKVSQEEVLL